MSSLGKGWGVNLNLLRTRPISPCRDDDINLVDCATGFRLEAFRSTSRVIKATPKCHPVITFSKTPVLTLHLLNCFSEQSPSPCKNNASPASPDQIQQTRKAAEQLREKPIDVDIDEEKMDNLRVQSLDEDSTEYLAVLRRVKLKHERNLRLIEEMYYRETGNKQPPHVKTCENSDHVPSCTPNLKICCRWLILYCSDFRDKIIDMDWGTDCTSPVFVLQSQKRIGNVNDRSTSLSRLPQRGSYQHSLFKQYFTDIRNL